MVTRAHADALQPLLVTLHGVLAPHRLHFGYRTVEELAKYVWFSTYNDILGFDEALDLQINQKVLPKLRGGREHQDMLMALQKALYGYPVSLAIVRRMQGELDLYDSFQF